MIITTKAMTSPIERPIAKALSKTQDIIAFIIGADFLGALNANAPRKIVTVNSTKNWQSRSPGAMAPKEPWLTQLWVLWRQYRLPICAHQSFETVKFYEQLSNKNMTNFA